MSTTVTIPALAGDLEALRFDPATPNGAGIVVVQEIFGVGDYMVARCEDLAAEGYVVVAPVLFDRLDQPPEIDETAENYVMQGVEAVSALDWQTAVDDVVAAVAALKADPDVAKVGLVGFCFGGGVAFQAAAGCDVDALVSYYGSALPTLTHLAAELRSPQLHHFGTEDAYISVDVQSTIQEALGDSQGPVRWYTYAGAGHAFDNPHPLFFHESASDEAWPRTLGFLRHYLHG